MPQPPSLDERCRLNGLAREYVNFRGQTQRVSDQTLTAMLAQLESDGPPSSPALNVSPASESARGSGPRSGMLPTQVLIEGGPRQLLLPAGDDCDVWHLLLEDGRQLRGPVSGRTFVLPDSVPFGYHRLSVARQPVDDQADDASAAASGHLIVCPARCFVDPRIDPLTGSNERRWGLTFQLYALRSERNWGIGDFGDLQAMIDIAGKAGASFIGLNPMHAMFPAEPGRRSPYSPSNRQFLNVLYVDVPGLAECRPGSQAHALIRDQRFQARLRELRDSAHVDYEQVARIKLTVLALLFMDFEAMAAAGGQANGDAVAQARVRDYRAFVQEGGTSLEHHARFDALAFTGDRWPAAGLPADCLAQTLPAASVARLRSTFANPEFFLYLQWAADRQLKAAADRCIDRGLTMGLYLDVAVGASRDGSEIAAAPDLYALGLRVGTPAEMFNPRGQDWGFSPLSPSKLRQAGYRPIIDLLRAAMRHAGVIRLDHAMSLQRLFCMIAGAGASAGTYLSYDLQALLGIVALESQRNRCMVVAEALGTVPPGFVETLGTHGLLTYNVLFFERDENDRFLRPHQWPPLAFGVVRTHDHATFPAWWRAGDVHLRQRLGLYDGAPRTDTGEPTTAQPDLDVRERDRDKQHLWQAFAAERIVDEATTTGVPDTDRPPLDLVHRFVASTRAGLVAVALEDIAHQLEPINVPGTTEEQHANWSLKLPVSVEQLSPDARWHRTVSLLADRSRR